MRSLLLVAASFVVPLAAQGDTCSGLQLKALAEAPVGTTPSALASGDWNRDGRLDLAVANRGSKDVSILLGDGAGGFAAATGSPVSVAGTPIDVAVADLDHDGFQGRRGRVRLVADDRAGPEGTGGRDVRQRGHDDTRPGPRPRPDTDPARPAHE
jgi:hypothetical protein